MYLVANYKYTLFYIFSILAVLLAFTYFPLLIPIPFTNGNVISFWSFIVGFWFVLRDFSQRELGHYVLIPMAIGISLSALINPAYALAATISSSFSELTDWAVYSFSKYPFHQRILISSLAACPLDTFAFYYAFDTLQVVPGLQIFSIPTIIVGSIGKILAAILVWHIHRPQKAS